MKQEMHQFMEVMTSSTEKLALSDAEEIARSKFGIEATADYLTGERDENIWLQAGDENYVLKISSPVEKKEAELTLDTLLYMEKTCPEIPCPRVIRSLAGETSFELDEGGIIRTARILTYLPGTPLWTAPRSSAQQRACGTMNARLSLAMQSYAHPLAHRKIIWDIKNLPDVQYLLPEMSGFPPLELVRDFIQQFEANISPVLPTLRHQVAHNDMNARNVIVAPSNPDKITGIIDFGDMVYTATACDAAIAATAQATPGNVYDAVMECLQAYHAVKPLEKAEIEIMNWLVAGRMMMDMTIPTWQKIKTPENTHHNRINSDFISARTAAIREMIDRPVTL